MTSVENMNFPSPQVLKEAMIKHFKVPVVFKNTLKSWHIPWTHEYLSSHFRNITLDFRVVPKILSDIAWERNADYVNASVNEFLEWQAGGTTTAFQNFSNKEFWAYSSYNYINRIFGEEDEVSKVVDWSTFGFVSSTKDSAFWIGSEGSYTPCHFDTYGFNLVAQIYGRKRWILFPPEDNTYMYPTRIPYEESSVFSAVNILNPDFKIHPLFKFTHPHVITLVPGDVLFVPHKWWHFVQSLDTTISINTWMDLDSNSDSHLEEAVVRALMSSFISFLEPEGKSWLNINEELVSPEETLSYISSELKKIKLNKISEKKSNENDSSSSMTKSSKLFSKSDVHSTVHNLKDICHSDIQYIEPISFYEWYGKNIDMHIVDSEPKISVNHIVDTFVHPEVISLICNILKR